jgi:hypothetical protein
MKASNLCPGSPEKVKQLMHRDNTKPVDLRILRKNMWIP